MKKRLLNKIILFFCICFTIMCNLPVSAMEATFYDDFSDSTKCVAKTSNILFESENSPDSKRITRTNSDSGFVIWELEGLSYAEVGVVIYRSTNADINTAVTFEVSSDGLNWTEVQFSAGEPMSESGGWDSYQLSAAIVEPSKFIKIQLNDTIDISWAVKLDYIRLYNEADAPEVSAVDISQVPPTGDSSGLFVSLVCVAALLTAFAVCNMKRIRTMRIESEMKN